MTHSIQPGEAQRYKGYGPLCVAGLQRALDPVHHLYSRQLRNGEWGYTRGTEDVTGTCICLIGIDRFPLEAGTLALDPRRTLEAVIRRAARRSYPGGLGLLIWANAVVGGPKLDELVAASGMRLGDGSAYGGRLTTMEASWLLSGLLHELVRNPASRTRRVAETVMRELEERFAHGRGLMPHATRQGRLRHRVRSQLANFADQIYAVQAMAFASLVLGATSALTLARSLAERLVSFQGPRGQWWWHYDAHTGRVAERFPVYSVHQHAMAPMALMALEAAGGGGYSHAITASHDWLSRNELGVSMIDEAAQTIWRDVERGGGRLQLRLRQARMLLGRTPPGEAGAEPALKLNRETRPYEWAWCLYAGAIAGGSPSGSHIV